VYAGELIASVRKTGQAKELEVGTAFSVNGIPAGFFKNPVFAKRLRLIRRQQRREREALEGGSEPNPTLAFAAETSPQQELAKYRSHQRSRLLLITGVVAMAVFALVAYLLWK
jgi:hypothetical protein